MCKDVGGVAGCPGNGNHDRGTKQHDLNQMSGQKRDGDNAGDRGCRLDFVN